LPRRYLLADVTDNHFFVIHDSSLVIPIHPCHPRNPRLNFREWDDHEPALDC
jgi:hypothetical protein